MTEVVESSDAGRQNSIRFFWISLIITPLVLLVILEACASGSFISTTHSAEKVTLRLPAIIF